MITFHSIKSVRPRPTDITAKSSAVPGIVMLLFFGAAIVMVAVTGWPEQAIFRYAVYGMFGLGGFVSARVLHHAMSAQNWLASYDGERLAIKFRSFTNQYMNDADEAVVMLTADDVEWMRVTRETRTTPRRINGKRRDELTWLTHLDLKLRDPGELPNRLKLEQERLDQQSTRFDHHPVTLEPGGVLRITFRGAGAVVTTSADDFLQAISRLGRLEDELKFKNDLRNPATTDNEIDQRIRNAIDTGHIDKAATLLRWHRGLSLREASKCIGDLAKMARK